MSSSQYCNMLIAIYPFVMVLGVLASGQKMYETPEGLQCQLCPAGEYLEKDCLIYGSKPNCKPCWEGYYMDVPNHRTFCYSCTGCKQTMEMVIPCSNKMDTVCKCPLGKFFKGRGDGLCRKHTECKGKTIKEGTPWHDTVCDEVLSNSTGSTGTNTSTGINISTGIISIAADGVLGESSPSISNSQLSTPPTYLTKTNKETNISIGGSNTKSNNSETGRPTGEMVQNILITIVVTVIVTLAIVFTVYCLNKKYGLWRKLKQNCQCRSQGGDIENQDGDVLNTRIDNEEEHLDTDKQSAYLGEKGGEEEIARDIENGEQKQSLMSDEAELENYPLLELRPVNNETGSQNLRRNVNG